MLAEHGIGQTNAEEYIIKLVSACFDLNLSPVELVNFLFDFRAVCIKIHWTLKRLHEFVVYKLRILNYTNRQILEQSKMLTKIQCGVGQQMEKLRDDYPHYAASLDAKDQLNEKLKSRIEQMVAERAPPACPFCMEHVDDLKLGQLHEIVGNNITAADVVRKSQDVVENPQKYASLFLPKILVERDDSPEPIIDSVIN